MATVLGQYKQYQEGLLKKINDGSLKQQELLAFQELNYRIATLELMQAYCRTAPAARDRAQISGGGLQRSVPPFSELQRRDAGALPKIRPGNDQHGAPRLGQLPYKLHQH